jgi:hypothetical protein
MSMWLRSIRLCGAVVAIAATAAPACGGHDHAQRSTRAPKLPHAVAVQLAAVSDDVARKLDAGDECAALAAARRLQQQTIKAIDSGRVPGRFQETLQATATDLVARIRCVPPPQPTPAAPSKDKPKNGHKGHGKHKGHGGDEGE